MKINQKFTIDSNALCTLFDQQQDIIIFAKDSEYKIVLSNQTNANLLSFGNLENLIGKTVFQLLPKPIANEMHLDDQKVINDGLNIVKYELISDCHGIASWYQTSKFPMYKNNKIYGLIGLCRKIKATNISLANKQLTKSLTYIQNNLNINISVTQLAKMESMSESTFRRQFLNFFKISPSEFILKARIQKACVLLSTTDKSMSKIADLCGFCNQGYFSKQFTKSTGLSPMKFKTQFKV